MDRHVSGISSFQEEDFVLMDVDVVRLFHTRKRKTKKPEIICRKIRLEYSSEFYHLNTQFLQQ
uniref:Uncharacterized protein n=1 Tax=Nelumbo nucifera TaxID=4432 RepID=A0A822Y3J1_NELNU|nr:TPA_asm: hypothetical protein HUJ06_028618 [Nelumbo nucifera]